MNARVGILIIISAFIFSFGIIYLGFTISYNKEEETLREQIYAEINTSDEEFYNIWLNIAGDLNISDEYEEEFRKVLPFLLYGTSDEDDAVVTNWLEKKSKRFTKSHYNTIRNSVEIYRIDFIKNQDALLSHIKERDELCNYYPGIIFICHKEQIYYEPILLNR